MARLSGDSVTRSSLLPARAMMMFSLAWRWSSFTQAFALSREAWKSRAMSVFFSFFPSHLSRHGGRTYSLCDVVDDYGAVCVSVVHGRERLVAFLTGGIPDFKLDGCVFIEGDGLGEEGGADGGFPVVVELILVGLAAEPSCVCGRNMSYLDEAQHERRLRGVSLCHGCLDRLAHLSDGGFSWCLLVYLLAPTVLFKDKSYPATPA